MSQRSGNERNSQRCSEMIRDADRLLAQLSDSDPDDSSQRLKLARDELSNKALREQQVERARRSAEDEVLRAISRLDKELKAARRPRRTC